MREAAEHTVLAKLAPALVAALGLGEALLLLLGKPALLLRPALRLQLRLGGLSRQAFPLLLGKGSAVRIAAFL